MNHSVSSRTRASRKRKKLADYYQEEVEEKLPLALEVFGNDVIIRKLKRFLPLDGLKSLRQVCKTLNSAILQKTDFTSTVELTLTYSAFIHHCLYSLSFEPRHLKIIPFPLQNNNFQSLFPECPEQKVTRQVCKLVRSCQSLTVWNKEDPDNPVGYNLEDYFQKKRTEIKDLNLDTLKLPKHCPDISKVVLSGCKLLSLSLNEASPYFLAGASQHQAKGLGNLLELEWNEWIPGSCQRSFYCPKIFMGLKGLKRLGFGGLDSIEDYKECPTSLESCRRFRTVLRNNVGTLTDWSILMSLNNYWDFGLDSLKLYPTLTRIQCGEFDHFLYHQLIAYRNTVEDLSLTCPETDYEIRKMVSTITQPRESPMPRLRKLRIHSLYHSNVRNFVEKFMYLLQNLKKLEEFELHVGTEDESQLLPPSSDLLASVPNKCNLKKLRLSGEQLILHPQSFFSLQEYGSLAVLELVEVAGLTDLFMRKLFRHVTRLRKLLISGVYELTDAALVEPSQIPGELPPPLSRQRYLKKLSLIDIPKMTSKGFREGIQSKCLEELVLMGMENNLDDYDLAFLLDQNPSLKALKAELTDEQQIQVYYEIRSRRNLVD